jgi:hypothetical protein
VNVVKFPYDACRAVHSRKPRRSKNGTPEERAARAATIAAGQVSAPVIDLSDRSEPPSRPVRIMTGAQWEVHQLAGARAAADVHGPGIQNYAPLLLGQGMSELTPQHVLVDLFGSGDFPAEVLDPVHAAEIVIQRLNDAGFEIRSAE